MYELKTELDTYWPPGRGWDGGVLVGIFDEGVQHDSLNHDSISDQNAFFSWHLSLYPFPDLGGVVQSPIS